MKEGEGLDGGQRTMLRLLYLALSLSLASYDRPDLGTREPKSVPAFRKYMFCLCLTVTRARYLFVLWFSLDGIRGACNAISCLNREQGIAG